MLAGLVAITASCAFVDAVAFIIGVIVKGARSERIGHGKIFVLDLERCVRIRTGETGSVAIGLARGAPGGPS